MTGWPAGWGREVHDRLDSTHAEALRRAASAPGPLWILAREQTAARGRRGRAWATGRGNFAASLLISPPGGPGAAALRSFTAALALRDALVELTRSPTLFSLKWPNDVLLEGRKLAGILLETAGPPLRLAIGFGVNLVEAPDPATLEETAMTPTSLKAAFRDAPSPDALLDALAPAFARWEARLTGEGFAPVRDAWLAGAANLGGRVTARLPGRTIEGTFETIDASGAIVMTAAGGRVVLPAAEIQFGPDPNPAPGPIPGDLPGQPPPAPGPDLPPGQPPVPGPDMPPEQPPAGDPPMPDVPPDLPPEGDPPAPDMPPDMPPAGDPPGPDVPPELPPEPTPGMPPPPPRELPPGQPPPVLMRHAPRH